MEYAAVFIAGIALGLFYFGGLWLTTRSLAEPPGKQTCTQPSIPPALKLILSFVGRMGVTLVCLYWLMQGNWLRVIIALLGMLLARFLVRCWVAPKSRQEVAE